MFRRKGRRYTLDSRPIPPPVLYKYMAPSRVTLLKNLRVRFTQPSAFNDPFDCRSRAVVALHTHTSIDYLEEQGPLRDHLVQPGPTSGGALDDETLQWFHPEPRRRSRSIRQWMSGELHGGYRKQAKLGRLGILSLSENWDNILMWSHYADSHRGLVIGLDTRHRFFTKRDTRTLDLPGQDTMMGMTMGPAEPLMVPPLCVVMYVDRHVSNLRLSPMSLTLSSPELLDYAEFLFKADVWAYEREWRLFRRLTNVDDSDDRSARRVHRHHGFFSHRRYLDDTPSDQRLCLFDIPPDCLVEVIMGLSMSQSDRRYVAETLVRSPALKHVKLKAVVSSTDYALRSVDVNPYQLLSSSSEYVQELSNPRLADDLREAFAMYPQETLQEFLSFVESGRGALNYDISPETIATVIRETLATTSSAPAHQVSAKAD